MPAAKTAAKTATKSDYTYLGPATTVEGKPVPADGLTMSLSRNQFLAMRARGHRFEQADEKVARRPTPQEVNATGGAAALPIEELAEIVNVPITSLGTQELSPEVPTEE